MVISEVMASNTRGIQDSEGDRSDWVEIHNECETQQTLNGWYLSDDKDKPDKWRFPDQTLDAHAYLIVFASGKNRNAVGSELHASFRLRRAGEDLTLTSPTGQPATWFTPFPEQRADVSFGFATASNSMGPLNPRFFTDATPGEVNAEQSFAGFVAEVEFNVPAGLYDTPLSIQMGTTTDNAKVVFTTDGSSPTMVNGTQLETAAPAVTVTRTTLLRAEAFREDFIPSVVQTRTFVFPAYAHLQTNDAAFDKGEPKFWGTTPADYEMDPDVVGPDDKFDCYFSSRLTESLSSLPSISLAMDVEDLFGSSGIYSNATQAGPEWERPVSVEIIGHEASPHIQIEAGIRIHGNASRSFLETNKKSFRLYFRSEYGAGSLNADLFGSGSVKEFKSLVLRAGFDDTWSAIDTEENAQYVRDEWMRRTQLEMGHAASHGAFVHLYLNGLYWGVYNLVERLDDNFMSSYLGGQPDEWDVIRRLEFDGSDHAWNVVLELAETVATADPISRDVAFRQLIGEIPLPGEFNGERLFDVNNYIDYMILNFYGATSDWPSNNWVAARRRGPESMGFQFFVWDAELSLGAHSTVATNHLSVRGGVADIFQNLRTHERFRNMVANRVKLLFAPGGALSTMHRTGVDQHEIVDNRSAARYYGLSLNVELALIAESARWGDEHRPDAPYLQTDWQKTRDALLSNYFSMRASNVFQQFVAAGMVQTSPGPRLLTDDTIKQLRLRAHQEHWRVN